MSAYELNEKLELWKIDNWDKDPRYKCPVPIKWPKLGIPTVSQVTTGLSTRLGEITSVSTRGRISNGDRGELQRTLYPE